MSNRSARAAEEISREMGLTIANDVHKLKQHRAEHANPTRQTVKEQLQRIAYGELGRGHNDIRDFLAALRKQGVRIIPMENKQGKTYGLRFSYAGQTFKASEIGREFGCRSLLNQFRITAEGQKGISKVPRYPIRRQAPEPPQQRHEQHQAQSLGASLIEGVADAIGTMMTPSTSDYDPTLAEWYEMLKRKKKKKKAHGISR
ncbi:hypothetical protein I180019D1_27700 [Alistipes sp. i18-0019-D1]|jgi:hypothetical protein